jgi:hypothetical protein
MRLQLWDTAGQERFRSLTSNFFGRADGFVLAYDISNRPSFDHVVGWMRDIKQRAPPDVDIVLCGNKSDLDNDRVVSVEEGKMLADEYNVGFFETSALTGSNVEDMFMSLAAEIKRCVYLFTCVCVCVCVFVYVCVCTWRLCMNVIYILTHIIILYIHRKRIDELEASGNHDGMSVTDQSQAGTVKLGDQSKGLPGKGALNNCC